MPKKSPAKTEHDTRIYYCRICGQKVEMPIRKWRALPTKYKRTCPDCFNHATAPVERGYHPYGPYNFFGVI